MLWGGNTREVFWESRISGPAPSRAESRAAPGAETKSVGERSASRLPFYPLSLEGIPKSPFPLSPPPRHRGMRSQKPSGPAWLSCPRHWFFRKGVSSSGRKNQVPSNLGSSVGAKKGGRPCLVTVGPSGGEGSPARSLLVV